MRKKIKVSDLRIGMYLDKLDGTWLQHPFWKTAFNLIEIKDLKAIQECGIKYLWIDTAKGLDVEEKPEVEKAAPDVVKAEKPVQEKVSLEDELEHERETLSKAKENDAIIIASAITRVQENSYQSMIKNIQMIENCCQVFYEKPVGHITFLSSIDVYGIDIKFDMVGLRSG